MGHHSSLTQFGNSLSASISQVGIYTFQQTHKLSYSLWLAIQPLIAYLTLYMVISQITVPSERKMRLSRYLLNQVDCCRRESIKILGNKMFNLSLQFVFFRYVDLAVGISECSTRSAILLVHCRLCNEPVISIS